MDCLENDRLKQSIKDQVRLWLWSLFPFWTIQFVQKKDQGQFYTAPGKSSDLRRLDVPIAKYTRILRKVLECFCQDKKCFRNYTSQIEDFVFYRILLFFLSKRVKPANTHSLHCLKI